MEQAQINKIKETIAEFFDKMTISTSSLAVSSDSAEQGEAVQADVKLDEPQILIGQQGQTLLEIQRLLRVILNKKLQTTFYLNLDINDYKKKKVEYLKDLAKDLADQVALSKMTKKLSPMSSYERRIVHSELSQRTDVTTESEGEGLDRHIVIRPK